MGVDFSKHFSLGKFSSNTRAMTRDGVLGFASTVRFYHGCLNGLLMTFLGYETTQWNAWLNLPELESSYKLAAWPLPLRSEGF